MCMHARTCALPARDALALITFLFGFDELMSQTFAVGSNSCFFKKNKNSERSRAAQTARYARIATRLPPRLRPPRARRRAMEGAAAADAARPYWAVAAICGALAAALYYFTAHITRATPRVVRRASANHVWRHRRRPRLLFFRGRGRAPHVSLDLDAGVVSLGPDRSRDAHVRDVHVVDQGLHLRAGRALKLAMGPDGPERLVEFDSRDARAAFCDVLHHAQGGSERPPNVSLFLTTFNVGNSQPPNNLSAWLAESAGADVIAVGAQECTYTTTPPTEQQSSDSSSGSSFTNADGPEAPAENPVSSASEDGASALAPGVSAGSSTSDTVPTTVNGKEHWQALVASHFSPDEYTRISQLSAWDRCLTIFVKNSLLSAVSHVRSDTANVGLGGVAGNKGAIGTRFSVYDTQFVILNSHLAAHHGEVQRRNEDFVSIAGSLRLLRDGPDVDILSSVVHHVFWMGDLNYRINLERDEVLSLANERDWERLRDADQLSAAMRDFDAFGEFSEGLLDFPPTYRYERGTRTYSAAKMRIPSWCDRILWRSLPGTRAKVERYWSADAIMTSDHSPVVATITADLVHTTGVRALEDVGSGVTDVSSGHSPSPLSSSSSPPPSLSGLRIVVTRLSAESIPDMNYGSRRVAVAKALNLQTRLSFRKHEDLGDGQHADPYCVFHGSAVAELDEGEYRTPTIAASQNPAWVAEDIPEVHLADIDMEVLRRMYLTVTVKDEDFGSRDDIVGSVILWLGAGDWSDDNSLRAPVEFQKPIMLAGRRQGTLSGAYTIEGS